MSNVIEFKNVSKHYKDFSIDDLNLEIKKGFVTGLIGHNGAGKSTIIDMIMNLTIPSSGLINVFDLDVTRNEREIKQRIGFVDSGNQYMESFNLKDLVSYVSNAYSDWDSEAFNRYAEKFDLPSNRKLSKFSTGMRVKASIAIALSHNADLLIMDEPTSGLDPVIRREILEIFREVMLDENKSIIFSSHITEDLEKIADYIVMIENGKIILNKSKDELIDTYHIVKGNNELLDRDTELYFDSIKKDRVNFEALTHQKSEVEKVFGDTVIIESIKMDDLYYHIKEEK